jgi:hypothetical protein
MFVNKRENSYRFLLIGDLFQEIKNKGFAGGSS